MTGVQTCALPICSFRDDASNPQETGGGPREVRGQVGWELGASTWRQGEVGRRCGMGSSRRVDGDLSETCTVIAAIMRIFQTIQLKQRKLEFRLLVSIK